MNKEQMFRPMENYVPQNLWDNLMFMGTSEGIYLYKHIYTRMYINVDKKGNFYEYMCDNTYTKISKQQAINHVNS